MAADCCFQSRPPLERLRVLCVTCLVLDCLFVFIYGMMALSFSGHTAKTECYMRHGYIWHEVVAGTLMISALIAVGGAVTHSVVACNTPNTEPQFASVSRFAHSLVCWTFLQAVLEAIAYRQEPEECLAIGQATMGGSGAATGSEHMGGEHMGDGLHPEEHAVVVYQVASTMLWLVWVTGCVAAGVLARRCVMLLPEACMPAGSELSSGGTPQTVGMPVSQLPLGMVAVTGASTMSPDGQEAVFGGHGPPLVGPGVVVAQGMPVNGASGPDPLKGGAGASGGKC